MSSEKKIDLTSDFIVREIHTLKQEVEHVKNQLKRHILERIPRETIRIDLLSYLKHFKSLKENLKFNISKDELNKLIKDLGVDDIIKDLSKRLEEIEEELKKEGTFKGRDIY